MDNRKTIRQVSVSNNWYFGSSISETALLPAVIYWSTSHWSNKSLAWRRTGDAGWSRIACDAWMALRDPFWIFMTWQYAMLHLGANWMPRIDPCWSYRGAEVVPFFHIISSLYFLLHVYCRANSFAICRAAANLQNFSWFDVLQATFPQLWFSSFCCAVVCSIRQTEPSHFSIKDRQDAAIGRGNAPS